MTDGTLLQRERHVSTLVHEYSTNRESVAETFVLSQTRTDFDNLLGELRTATDQCERLRLRGVDVELPSPQAVGAKITAFRSAVASDPGAVTERTDVHGAMEQYVQKYAAAATDATSRYVAEALSGVDYGVVELIRQVGMRDEASRLAAALGILQKATSVLPTTESGLDMVDAAAAEVKSIMSALDDPAHARLVSFVQALVSSGGSIGLDTLDDEQLKELKSSGAAENFVIRARARS